MLRNILVLLTIFTIELSTAICQGLIPPTGFEQYEFLDSFVKDNPIPRPLKNNDDIVLYYKKMTVEWKINVNNKSPEISWLSPYLYIWSLHKYYDTKEPEWAKQTLLSKYMLPSFFERTDGFISSKSKNKNLNLKVSDISWICSDLTVSTSLSIEQLQHLKESLIKLSSALELSMSDMNLNDSLKNKYYKVMQRLMLNYLPLIEIKIDIHNNHLDSAKNKLELAINDKYEAYKILPLANDLWRSFIISKNTQKALNILNTLSRSFTSVDLSNDSLRIWYRTLDFQFTDDKYDNLILKNRPNPLKESSERVSLQGVYIDLTTGNPIDLNIFNGKLLLLDFWATWCSPCIEEIPLLREFIKKYGDRVIMVSVCSDAVTNTADFPTAKKFAEEKGINYTALYDVTSQSLTNQFKVNGWPAKYLIGKNNKLIVRPYDKTDNSVQLKDVVKYLDGYSK